MNRFKVKGLGTAALCALALLLLSFVRRAGDVGSSAFHNGVLDNMLVGRVWGTALGWNIFRFGVALLLIHAAFGMACWCLGRLSEYAFPNVRASRSQWILVWAVALILWLLVTNAALFPSSSLGAPYSDVVRAGWGFFDLFHVVSAALICALAGLGAASVWRVASLPRAGRRPHARLLALTGAAVAAIGIAVAYASQSREPVFDKPHVIIIGIDSLRYDVASVRGPKSLAPHVRKFLDSAVSFSDAITPLARTFPSWVSILTGRDPYTTGALVNLIPRSMVHTGDTLGDLYRRAGYHTVYGIDEVRFSNVDGSYGFDQTLTPRIGASDFLLGWFGDTPLLNLVVNSPLGAPLFPHLYANRADASLYEPDEFVDRIDRNVRFDRPTFMAVHLTLAHWPYTWATGGSKPTTSKEAPDVYGRAVQRVDRQFGDIMAVLERRGALKNALVIVLSDHGEGLAQPDDLLIPNGGILGEFDAHLQSTGHGTSVISPHQYQVVLAMQTFGAAHIPLPRGALINEPVSLEDLAPTLADLSGLQTKDRFDGQSLVPLMRGVPGAAESFRNRVRFTESEFNPRGLEIGVAPSTSALANAVQYYRLDPHTDHVEVRPEMLREVLNGRQYGALLGNRLLAAIPRDTEVALYDMVVVGRDGSDPRKLTGPPSAADDPQLAQLWKALMGKLGFTAYELKTDAKP